MSYTSNIEDAIYGVQTYITDNYNTYLDGIEQAKDDGITTEDFKISEVGEGDPFTSAQYPALYIYPSAVSEEEQTIGIQTVSIELAFIMAISGGHKSNLAKAALRYAEAMRQCLIADTTCADAVDHTSGEFSVEYYPIVAGGSNIKVTVFTAVFMIDVNR